jgi:type II secretory pathway pseudopilin PulG
MATTHPTVTRTSIADHWRGLANGGAGSTTVRIFDASNNQLVSINITDFAAASSGTTTSSSSGNSGTAGATGTASYGTIADGDGTERARGSVGVGSGEFQISSTSITSGDTVSLTANPTWTAPA